MKQRTAEINTILNTCPIHEGGVHQWLWKAAMKLMAYGTDEEIIQWLLRATATYSRKVTRREASNAVTNARSRSLDLLDDDPTPTRPLKLTRRSGHIQYLANQVRTDTVDGLRLISRNPGLSQDDLLQSLFPHDPLICAGTDTTHAITRPLSDHGDLSNHQFIVPSPMSTTLGVTCDGKGGRPRTLNNTGPRQYVIYEGDFASVVNGDRPLAEAMCAVAILELALSFPLVMVVRSGGQSLHGWFRADDEDCTAFRQAAYSLGADPAPFIKSAWVRIPEGLRVPKRPGRPHVRQNVLYFNKKECAT